MALRPGGRSRRSLLAIGARGKTPHAFRDEERVAAEDNGDVVVPAGESTPLVVVETELALEILVDPLGPPALLDAALFTAYVRRLQVSLSRALHQSFDDSGPWFRFSTRSGREESYRHYVRLGNRLMSEVNRKQLLDGMCRVPYSLHAAIFDACIISFDPEVHGAPKVS